MQGSTETRKEEAPPHPTTAPSAHDRKPHFWTLALGCTGVVYGDIGTSPLYAFHEAATRTLHGDGTIDQAAVLGVLSLILWALVIIVTLKYVLFLLRADNKGEGGVLSLMAQARPVAGKATPAVFFLGMAGAALFYGDSAITPAISVLSAVEGLKLVTPAFTHLVLPLSLVILIALFLVQKTGTGKVSFFFGPITVLWFLTLGLTGILSIVKHPSVLMAISPWYGVHFLALHSDIALFVLGGVFLAVTGAEALYADLGHFGRKPIQTAWLYLVFPCLILNYMGQGALVLHDPTALENPFYRLVPEWALLPLVGLATIATIIASQAVITGTYSLTRQAIQLGLLPRMEIRHTSHEHEGQIYMPKINTLLLLAVLFLCLVFGSSAALANAYGISVTGAIAIDSILAFIVVWKVWNKGLLMAALMVLPFLAVEFVFLSANMLKIFDGGLVPLMIAAFLAMLMFVWVKGSRYLQIRSRRQSMDMDVFLANLKENPPLWIDGTAIFLTADSDEAPLAMIQNLKHNKVMHKNNIILTVITSHTPRVPTSERITTQRISPHIVRMTMVFGYMQTPDVPHALAVAAWQGSDISVHDATYFLSRRKVVSDPVRGLPLWQDHLYITMNRASATATDFFRLPPGHVVEMGMQIGI